MKTHDLVQGSAEWKAYRAQHFNASDAPAMMGLSPYKTRTQLLDEMKSGISPEIDSATQSRFDDGHRFEALARPLAEEIIGQELYPVTGSEGKLSTSFDGLTLDESICFEHKTLNDEIRAATCAMELGAHLRAQMEQQLMISGAEKCLFMASKWNGETLVEEVHHWYTSDQTMRDALVYGWTQFGEDLISYVPKQVEEKPEAKAVMELPALFLQAEGRLVNSNMEAFGTALTLHLEETRKMVYVTDQDFADADKRAKMYRETCEKLALTKKAMLSQTVSIDEAFRMIDTWHEDLRTTALQIEKDVKKNKETKQLSILNEAKAEFASFIAELQSGISPITLNYPAPNFAEAIKGKRLFSSMINEVQTTLANAKAECRQLATEISANLNWLKAHDEYRFLFNDLQSIVYKKADDFQLLVTSRIADHKQRESEKLEAERVRIRNEEEAKAKAAQEKIAAEAESQRVADAKLEADRLAAVEAEKVPAQKTAQVEAPRVAPVQAWPFPTKQEPDSATESPASVPSRDQIIFAVAMHFKTDARTAAGWIEAEFSATAKAA